MFSDRLKIFLTRASISFGGLPWSKLLVSNVAFSFVIVNCAIAAPSYKRAWVGASNFEIYFKYYNPISKISDTYSEVPIGEVLCLFNSANYLEIAINMGKAASQLDLYKDETIQIKFK